MRILQCEVTNFGSYKEYFRYFDKSEPSLLYGPTGAGKSTIPDMPCWVMFGVTAKDGVVDDVRSWMANGEVTTGKVVVRTQAMELLVVIRHRGDKSHQNDLYWLEMDHENDKKQHRGKDMAETQKLLNQRLGVDPDLYILASYFHEFSPSGSFFVAKAKTRRELFERVASLEFPVRLGDVVSAARFEAKKALDKAKVAETIALNNFCNFWNVQGETFNDHKAWQLNHEQSIIAATAAVASFEEEKRAKILNAQSKADKYAQDRAHQLACYKLQLADAQEQRDGLGDTKTALEQKQAELDNREEADPCPTCGNNVESTELLSLTDIIYVLREMHCKAGYLEDRISDLELKVSEYSGALNPYTRYVIEAKELTNYHILRLQELQDTKSPFAATLKKLTDQADTGNAALAMAIKSREEVANQLSKLIQLHDLALTLRGQLLQNAIQSIETSTNLYLEEYFDSEIRVGFILESSDDLKVAIHKDGHECNYRQLSKGQRGLLKLCFAVSIMEAASARAGVHFDNLWFDEALDGLDESLKLKAFRMFSHLTTNRQTVTVIDHSPELQAMFNKKYQVSLINDISEVTEQ